MKFNQEDMENIKRLYEEKQTIRIISRLYHVRDTTISKILKSFGCDTNRHNSFYYTSEQLATNRKYACNFDYFENIDTRTKAYWLGFLFADGCVLDKRNEKRTSKGKTLTFTLKEEDLYMIQLFRDCLGSNHPIRKKSIHLGDKVFYAYSYDIGSVKMCDDLIALGCTPRKSLTLRYPEKLSDEFFSDFARGYFDGDGCVSYDLEHKRTFVAFDGTFEFLSVMKEKLEGFGIKSGAVMRDKRNKANALRISNYDIHKFYDLLYGTAEYHLGRKVDKLREMLYDRKEDFILSPVARLAELIK
jgi:hypothetical protein